jgi:hypothetical protein
VGSLSRDRERGFSSVGGECVVVQQPCALCSCFSDGWAAYPKSIGLAKRSKVKCTAGRGRACLHIWPQLHIGTVICPHTPEACR